MTSFPDFLDAIRPAVDGELERLLPSESEPPQRLHEAMRYCIFAGGKRVRPALVALAGEALGARREHLLAGGAAMEMIHTFSLVHDDLPALDDDDLRRGRPTVHRRYDEALAILTGDALLNHALAVLAREPAAIDPGVRLRTVDVATRAVGSTGMIGGQVADMEAEADWPEDPEAALELIHQRKTGCLLTASLRIGGLYAGATEDEDRLLSRLGACVGLLFQIGDDILDVEGSTEALGKTAGKDAAARKLTYTELYGLDGARRRMDDLVAEGLGLAADLGGGAELAASLVRYLAARDR
ncbi:MAG: polyprenyl synthetase family protein [Thermoanaerobaculia bacterium]|nr:polyprenyl synthetase family protein [Thermoanaerobaculia bacterium]